MSLLHSSIVLSSQGLTGLYEGEYIGAVGNLVAAVLQTAGLYGQTDVLLFYQEVLQSIAGLLYVFSIAGAITAAAVFGSYRNAAYFLIGPLLFYSLMAGVTTAKPTAVQVGTRLEEGAQEVQQQLLSVYLDEGSEVYTREIKLSWFFVAFDNLVTNVSQNIISVLIDEDNRKDILNVGRERGLAEILGARNTDRNLMEVANVALVGKCSEVMNNYLEAGQPGVREAAEGTPAATRRTELLAEAGKGFYTNNVSLPGDLLKRLGNEVTTERLSKLRAFPQDASEKWNSILKKPVHSCSDVWTMVKVLTYLQAYDKVQEIQSREDTDPTAVKTPWPEVVSELEKTFAPDMTEPQRQAVLMEVLSNNIFKNAMNSTSHSRLMGQIDSHIGFNNDQQVFDDVFAGYYSIEGQGALARLAMFTGVVPYLQGLFLFVLATSFPFFCIFLVMPTRVSSFLTWLWLWVWVKSWDVGFAAIHVLRDVLWEWLGKASAPYLVKQVSVSTDPEDLPLDMSNYLMKVDYTAIDWNDPSAVFHAVIQGDPMANISTYYILISLVTLSVPVLTAHLCRGAGQILGAFQQSFEGLADNFGKTYNNRMEQYSANAMNDHSNQAATAYALGKAQEFIRQNNGSSSDMKQLMDGIRAGIFGNNSQIAGRGDGSLAAAAGALFTRSRTDFLYSNMGTSLQATRGMFTARQTLWDAGAGQGSYGARNEVDMALRTLAQNPAFAGNHFFADDSAGIAIPSSAGSGDDQVMKDKTKAEAGQSDDPE